jgi:NAD(P)H-hydrate repair Nnr-like enzyme with NAD(P)H-hydrate dehydratase domain
MAAPGMGDVLTGVIAALLGQRIQGQRIQGQRQQGQRMTVSLAARVGVLWHALAGDLIASKSAAGVWIAGEGGRARHDRGLLASELAAALPAALAASAVSASPAGLAT